MLGVAERHFFYFSPRALIARCTSSEFFWSGVFPLLCNRVSPLYVQRHFPNYEEDRVREPVQFIGSYLLLVSGG